MQLLKLILLIVSLLPLAPAHASFGSASGSGVDRLVVWDAAYDFCEAKNQRLVGFRNFVFHRFYNGTMKFGSPEFLDYAKSLDATRLTSEYQDLYGEIRSHQNNADQAGQEEWCSLFTLILNGIAPRSGNQIAHGESVSVFMLTDAAIWDADYPACKHLYPPGHKMHDSRERDRLFLSWVGRHEKVGTPGHTRLLGQLELVRKDKGYRAYYQMREDEHKQGALAGMDRMCKAYALERTNHDAASGAQDSLGTAISHDQHPKRIYFATAGMTSPIRQNKFVPRGSIWRSLSRRRKPSCLDVIAASMSHESVFRLAQIHGLGRSTNTRLGDTDHTGTPCTSRQGSTKLR